MTFASLANGTLTTDGTEQTLSTQTVATRYQTIIDFSNNANGDVVEVKVKIKVLSGGSAAICYYAVFQNVQANPIVVLPEFSSLYSYAVTVKKTAGSNHTYDWNMMEVERSEPLTPTVAGRTLDVSATGEAGVDWANVGSPTTSVGLTNTTISTTQAVASVSGAVGSVTAFSAAAIQSIWDALTANLMTANSIGKRLVDNIDATISSRLASASYTTPPTATQNADALLNRDMSAVSDTNSRSPLNALRMLRNKVDLVVSPGNMVVYKENDSTQAWTAALTTNAAANPITVVDPP